MRPSAGVEIAARCAVVIRGTSMPLVVDVMSRTELGSGVMVLTPTLWAIADDEVKAKMKAIAFAKKLWRPRKEMTVAFTKKLWRSMIAFAEKLRRSMIAFAEKLRRSMVDTVVKFILIDSIE